jgi:hypothetical protein
MLPPGTLSALKGHEDGIVTVVCLAVCLSAICVGVPSWAALGGLVIALVAFHIRATAKELHIQQLHPRQTTQIRVKAKD